jgi:hypothetical protein
MQLNLLWNLLLGFALLYGLSACGESSSDNMEEAGEEIENASQEVSEAFRSEREKLKAKIRPTHRG